MADFKASKNADLAELKASKNDGLAELKASKNDDLAEIKASRNREDEEEEEKLELSLGLSLNGKFGVDPRSKNLQRSYSVSNFRTPVVELTPGLSWGGGGVPLARTSSLPVEVEEESMKRREIQMLRRREAKRRRLEKMRYNGVGGEVQRVGCVPPPLSQGSSGSSGFTEFDCQTPPFLGLHKSAEVKSPQSVHSEQNEHRSLPTKLSSEMDNVTGISNLKPTRSISGTNEMVRNVLADMPCVSTKGHGPNGKRIEGFLYRYSKGEEVRIVCVCHGSFLTPAEFVKHAGGEDVEHPMRHIVVYSSSFL